MRQMFDESLTQIRKTLSTLETQMHKEFSKAEGIVLNADSKKMEISSEAKAVVKAAKSVVVDANSLQNKVQSLETAINVINSKLDSVAETDKTLKEGLLEVKEDVEKNTASFDKFLDDLNKPEPQAEDEDSEGIEADFVESVNSGITEVFVDPPVAPPVAPHVESVTPGVTDVPVAPQTEGSTDFVDIPFPKETSVREVDGVSVDQGLGGVETGQVQTVPGEKLVMNPAHAPKE